MGMTIEERRAYGRAYYAAHREKMLAQRDPVARSVYNREWNCRHPRPSRRQVKTLWPCEGCSPPLEGTARQRRRWCDACRRAGQNALNLAAYYANKPAPVERHCEGCQATFLTTRTQRQRFCDPTCRKRHRGDRRGDTNKRLRRRILEHDGWRCYLCGFAIDPALAFPDVLSASVDHLVPMSAGGTSDPANLAACHLRCNVEKGDRRADEVWPAIPVAALLVPDPAGEGGLPWA